MPVRINALLAATCAALASAPALAHGSVAVGIGDQQPQSFADPRLRGLGVTSARLIVPYDAATSEPAEVRSWLDATAAAGLAPQIAFEHLAGEDCATAGPCTLPSTATYRAAVAAFHARWPQVRTFTTWNEGNHQSQPTATRPEAVGAYYGALRAVCPTCTVVAGDALDSGSYVRWLRRVRAAAPGDPQLWGLHDYAETTYGSPASTEAVLAAVPGELWLEETGGIVTLRNASGVATLPYDEARAALAVTRAFAVVRSHPRVTRMSVYQWAATAADRFDAGLVRPDGTPRSSLDAVARGIASLSEAATAQGGPSVRTSWSTERRGQLLVRLRCRATASTCAGRARLWLLTRRSSSGRRIRTKLGVRHYATSSSSTTVTLRLRVPTGALRRARGRSSRLELRLAPTSPATAPATTLRRVVRRAR